MHFKYFVQFFKVLTFCRYVSYSADYRLSSWMVDIDSNVNSWSKLLTPAAVLKNTKSVWVISAESEDCEKLCKIFKRNRSCDLETLVTVHVRTVSLCLLLCSGTFISFLSGLVWVRFQVYCACCFDANY